MQARVKTFKEIGLSEDDMRKYDVGFTKQMDKFINKMININPHTNNSLIDMYQELSEGWFFKEDWLDFETNTSKFIEEL